MKKERRKEQNRRAARKCREKKKLHTDHMINVSFPAQSLECVIKTFVF
jgi:hypothetical protein